MIYDKPSLTFKELLENPLYITMRKITNEVGGKLQSQNVRIDI